MKRVTAILCCLLFVFSTSVPLVAVSTGAGKACGGCGCAAATCCSAPDNAGPQAPAVPPVNENLGGLQKLVALAAEIRPDLRFSDRPMVAPSARPEKFVARVVPLYLRNCRFLI